MAAEGRSEIPPIDAHFSGDGERSARFYVSAVSEGSAEDETAIVYALETTEQRALEAQFTQSQKMQAVGQLAGGVAHDFNNVLTAIIGFSDLLLANHRPSDPAFQDIMNIKQNANRAAGLVRQLLAFSRRQTLRPQVLSLSDALSDLSILLQRLLGESVKLQLLHGRDLWPVKADINQFEQVIVNLAVNARDAMPTGGALSIRTSNVPAAEVSRFGYRQLPEADYVMIEVEDTGTGMTPEVQAKIFEPFFSTKEVGKGTGLGLSTAYGIVRQTGGHIFFTSTVGEGTTFRIFLPRHAVEEEQPATVSAGEEKTTAIADLTGSATILLVEDEEAVRAFSARALETRGYTVKAAATGVEALEVFNQLEGKVDLVVSDVVMPEMDGPSLLRELRKTRPDLKIIFVSGYAEEAFRKNLPEGESFHFLPKPFSLKQLATAVKETMGQ
jgi:two-component system cell cycle sensor histidine kinase/response regulator CckA